jgi:hypothetical protein
MYLCDPVTKLTGVWNDADGRGRKNSSGRTCIIQDICHIRYLSITLSVEVYYYDTSTYNRSGDKKLLSQVRI